MNESEETPREPRIVTGEASVVMKVRDKVFAVHSTKTIQAVTYVAASSPTDAERRMASGEGQEILLSGTAEDAAVTNVEDVTVHFEAMAEVWSDARPPIDEG